jgi:branched-chain amino acid transport system ATP-binding protein
MSLLEVDRLEVRYGGVRALHGISLHVDDGEIVTLLGANGAGKTTALRAISSLVRPHSGDVRFDGTSLVRVAPHDVALMGIGHVPEGRRVFARMSVRENLELGAYALSSRTVYAERLEEALTIFPRLRERIAQRAGTLSGGEQQMLAIARALMSAPRLLLLDEPSLGLSPILVQTIFSVIRTIHARGTTILLVEQNARQALRVATRGYVLENGTIAREAPAAQLLEDEGVIAAYLGGGG